MARHDRENVKTLEQGHIYFFYRPRVEEEQPEGLEDIQRLFIVLSPHGKKTYRLVTIGRKKLPDPEASGKRRFWGFVEYVASNPKEIEADLQEETYHTKTRGERHLPAARPSGEGIYRLMRHDNHTHLVYALEPPERPDEVQEALNIEDEASYILSIKNPSAPSPGYTGLGERRQAEYPKRLQEVFRERRFSEADPPDFLDHEGTEIVLIAAEEEVEKELGIKLQTQHETEATAEVFSDLRLEKSKHPIEPLFTGKWT